MSENKLKKEVHNMGSGTSEVFKGNNESTAIQEAYGKTADFFAEQIKQRLPICADPYTIVDVGTFKGELLSSILSKVHEQKFLTIGLDVNDEALKENSSAQTKIVASADEIPLPPKTADVSFARYVLQWNNIEKQKKILAELVRITKSFVLIEHSGPDIIKANEWRERFDDLFSGKDVPKMKRGEHYYASRDEIESWLNEMGFKFERLREKTIDKSSDIFIARFDLDTNEAGLVRSILGGSDHFTQTDWIIFPSK